ncbi:MAG: hypothetical protein AB7O24_21485 [Kofleriaceae bacterium]
MRPRFAIVLAILVSLAWWIHFPSAVPSGHVSARADRLAQSSRSHRSDASSTPPGWVSRRPPSLAPEAGARSEPANDLADGLMETIDEGDEAYADEVIGSVDEGDEAYADEVIGSVDEDDEAYLEAIPAAVERIHSVLDESPSDEEAVLLELLAAGPAPDAIPQEPGEPDTGTERLLERGAALAELVLGE